MYFGPMRSFAADNGIEVVEFTPETHGAIVLCLSDYLTERWIEEIKRNGNSVVGFNVTDSAYVSQACREAHTLRKIDMMFMLSGLQTVNHGYEFILDDNFNVSLETRQFLSSQDWEAFNDMRLAGRMHSLPYVHWNRQPEVHPMSFADRSKKVLIRGGGQLRRFILALFLMKMDGLDINSGLFCRPYFEESMNPQWRYCNSCRESYWRNGGRFHYQPNPQRNDCNSPADWSLNINYHGIETKWNNRCPKSFYWMAEQFEKRYGSLDKHALETLMNGQMLDQGQHLKILSRMAFTADLKWMFSIFAPQRFWDGAMVGAVNYLPKRTFDQEYFPEILPEVHYHEFTEDFHDLKVDLDEATHQTMAHNARLLYDQWIRPAKYPINTNLLRHIFDTICNTLT